MAYINLKAYDKHAISRCSCLRVTAIDEHGPGFSVRASNKLHQGMCKCEVTRYRYTLVSKCEQDMFLTYLLSPAWLVGLQGWSRMGSSATPCS